MHSRDGDLETFTVLGARLKSDEIPASTECGGQRSAEKMLNPMMPEDLPVTRIPRQSWKSWPEIFGFTQGAAAVDGNGHGDTDAGEGFRDETSVKVEGRLAYAPQEPWIQWGTVRENILFGKRMDRESFTWVLINPVTRLPKSCTSTVQINHEHQERVVRTVRQEPSKGNRLCVVHVHRDGGGGIHLCLRGRRQEWWGWERVTGVRSRVDGAPADWPLRGRLPRDAKVPNFSRGGLFPGRGDYHVPDHAGAVRGVRRPGLHDERQQRETCGPRLRRFLLLPVCRVHDVCRYVGCLP